MKKKTDKPQRFKGPGQEWSAKRRKATKKLKLRARRNRHVRLPWHWLRCALLISVFVVDWGAHSQWWL